VIPGPHGVDLRALTDDPAAWKSQSRVENTPTKGMLMADEVANRNLALTPQTTDLRKR
jgi:hypothetical protein